MATSVDGRIAVSPLETTVARYDSGFLSPADLKHVHDVVAHNDAVIIGANTARASPHLLKQKNYRNVYPVWIVLTVKGVEGNSPFWQHQGIERWIVSPAPVTQYSHTGVRYMTYREHDPAVFVTELLQQHKMSKILLFGGGEINRLFYRSQLVDELIVTVCPIIVAQDRAPLLVPPPLDAPIRLELVSTRTVKNHVFIHYKVRY